MATLSDFEKVKQFTEESSGKACPKTPQLMTKDEVRFLVRMVLSEMSEVVNTVTESEEETIEFMESCLHADPSKHSADRRVVNLIAEQADGCVDAYYYILNAFCKKGVDLSAIFNVVHDANMAKKDPASGKFIRRESDGKILKPAGWKAPDIVAEIRRQGFSD
jgi:predicted HAD superfamily Cof-like phosphohydrolase